MMPWSVVYRLVSTLPVWAAAPALIASAAALPLAAAQSPILSQHISQHRINEYAASCLTAKMALGGLRGTPRPGERPAQYSTRIRSYVAALSTVARKTEPLRQLPALRDATPANARRWQRISAEAARLPARVGEAEAAWKAQVKIGEKAKLGAKLSRCLVSVETMLSLLRDARP
jgi:hypothetical protein